MAWLSVEAEGGKEPYTYEWSYYRDSKTVDGYAWYKVGSNGPDCPATLPGQYRCLVLDADKNIAWSKTIPVTYTGAAPWIIEQPQNKEVPDVPDGQFFTTLSCRAISGSFFLRLRFTL